MGEREAGCARAPEELGLLVAGRVEGEPERDGQGEALPGA
jgi:hypothetical protein